MKNNKKGFTLIELLAVIVILAVVMLIAVSAVGPLMAKSRKGSLSDEGIGIVDAAQTAYQAEQMNANSVIKSTSTVCFDLKYLNTKQYYPKGNSTDGYTGSVLVKYDSGKYTYTFWISNGTYVFGKDSGAGDGVDPNAIDLDDENIVYDGQTASSNCGGHADEPGVYCTLDADDKPKCTVVS